MPTEENRKAVSESNKRRTGPPKGYKHTPEARAKITAALTRRWRENSDAMIAALTKPPKPRELMRYRKDFTPWQRKEWKGSFCVWCGSSEKLVLDHIIPIVAGGINIEGNAQTLRWCMWIVRTIFPRWRQNRRRLSPNGRLVCTHDAARVTKLVLRSE
jgi:hypothetical protein